MQCLDKQEALIKDAVTSFQESPDVLAAVLVGSLAGGTGDRVSDADIVVFSTNNFHKNNSDQFEQFVIGKEVFYCLSGEHNDKACFRKYLFGDMTSAEIHILDVSEEFEICKPYKILFDKSSVTPSRISNQPAPKHENFPVFPNGDDGLIWELFDCVKWLSRGDKDLAKGYLKRLAKQL
ncbi:hypothetical protein CW749_02895 [Vibrio sp. vnigr-6D03]|uniref:nucleotidyltransferase domain-containing protein n=1 Tax=Vibrio sp. vnigr-6D03 TaxID=2058088 RepID=UPI000C32D8D3|nr:nucleotidyltransferase domain-containing protein [Vibrio sp. vnigr-6D03]PKF81600.1 hypothetical protein CW749_02895 [Vibrio sp. vnigr-6D03]